MTILIIFINFFIFSVAESLKNNNQSYFKYNICSNRLLIVNNFKFKLYYIALLLQK